MTYVELQVTSHFSFLRGVSSAEALFAAAALLGYEAMAITDRNSVAGLVHALRAAEATGVRLVAGCRLDLMDGQSILVWPEDRRGWSHLTRLLTIGKNRADPKKGQKGHCFLHWEDVAAWSEGLVGALVTGDPDEEAAASMARMARIFPGRAYAVLSHRRRPGDAVRLHALDQLARRAGIGSLAAGDVLYDSPDARMLQDVVTAIRHKCTVEALGFRREIYADRHLKGPEEMRRRFAAFPHAVEASREIEERCRFSLRELSYQYPDEILMPGRTAQQSLEQLSRDALAARFPEGAPKAYAELLDHELGLVGRLGYAPYFLTVNSIVAFARSRGILCQGRGSAANSMICFLLGITSIDPVEHKLLFERFISDSRHEPPDIDVDFEHERREEVIQWIYRTYGRRHAALTAVVSRYRSRGAIREVGKVMGLTQDVTAALASQIWGWSTDGVSERHVADLNLDASDPRLSLTLDLARRLIGTPRHLSQHPGGFVLTRDRLDDLVPIEPAAMDERHVIEWEKDDIEELGFMKVDVLGLGMLGCLRRAFDLLREHKVVDISLDDERLQKDDPIVYRMIQKADTLGTFQIESRAQMSMLPRLRPKEFYDIVIQVAIVRPGPIQGDMVHPYLRRREGKEAEEYPSEALRDVLAKTKGIPLFQEQAMKVAIVGAGFTPTEADALRRSMATFKFTGGVGAFRDKLIDGMIGNGYTRDFAERTFKQIEGFGSYGFPESHAASFAKIAYASAWVKCHHPDIFCAALLNAQPMGFYAPAQIVQDARDHRVEMRPVCVNASRWDCTLEPGRAVKPVRLGMRMVKGLAAIHAGRIIAARAERPFETIEDLWRRSGVPLAALERLADADAFLSLGLDRRQALWRLRGLGEAPLPLFAAADARDREPAVQLTALTEGREVVEDYRSTQLSLRAHPLSFIRPALDRLGAVPCGALAQLRDGRKVRLSGIVLIRQRPGAGNVTFVTVEDESGIANIIIWQRIFEAHRRIVLSAAMIAVTGHIQKEGEVIHIIADRLEDESHLLRAVGHSDFPHRTGPGDGARGASPDPRHRPPRSLPPARDEGIRVQTRDFH